jgi:hypothetical protein
LLSSSGKLVTDVLADAWYLSCAVERYKRDSTVFRRWEFVIVGSIVIEPRRWCRAGAYDGTQS